MIELNGYVIRYHRFYGIGVCRQEPDGTQTILKTGFQSALQAMKWIHTALGDCKATLDVIYRMQA